VGIAQEEVLGKEGSDEGNETCASLGLINSPLVGKELNVHRINAGRYITYMVSSYAFMTPALISGGLVLAVLMDPKILRISFALSLSLRYLFKLLGIFSLREPTSEYTASARDERPSLTSIWRWQLRFQWHPQSSSKEPTEQ